MSTEFLLSFPSVIFGTVCQPANEVLRLPATSSTDTSFLQKLLNLIFIFPIDDYRWHWQTDLGAMHIGNHCGRSENFL